MRACAEIGELALLIERDGLALGKVVYELDLEGLVCHELKGLFPGQLEALDGELLLADLSHLFFDLFHMLRRESKRREHIVVPALLDGRTDGELDFRPEALYGLSHDVGAAVPIGMAVLFVLERVLVFFRHFVFPP